MLADTQLWWFVARASGIVAWAVLAASVLWGLALSTKILGPRPRANWLLDLHRFLGGLAVVFVGVHVAGLVLDSYIHFGPAEILVPLTSSYRPGAVAWGVVSLYLLLAIEVTSLLRARIPRRMWRRTHFLSFLLFALATAHGLLAGTDSTGRLMFAAMVVVTGLVAGLTAARLYQYRRGGPNRGARRDGAASTQRAARRSPRPSIPTTSPPFVPDRSLVHAQVSRRPSSEPAGDAASGIAAGAVARRDGRASARLRR